jgi:hypothetical protein
VATTRPSYYFKDLGHVAEWLRNGLQNRVPRFNSGRGLHQYASAREYSREKALGILTTRQATATVV